ncbi:MAG: adenylate/guanylate cyclase domain-containing protein [Myxococcota bacterium]
MVPVPSPSLLASSSSPQHPFRLKLRVAIAASLLFVTVSLAIAITLINHRGSTQALRTATGALMRSSVGLVAAQTEALLEQVAARVEVSAVVLANETDKLSTHLDRVEMLLFALVQSGPDLYYAQFGAADGNFVLVSRNPSGGLDTKWILNGETSWTLRSPGQGLQEVEARRVDPGHDYDPRRRPWFQGASETHGLFWTRAYAHADSGEPVVTAARAIRTPSGEVAGVVSATLALSHLNRYLRNLSASKAIVFVADEHDQLVAISEGELNIGHQDPTELRLPKVSEAPFPQVATLGYNHVSRERPRNAQPGLQRVLVDREAYLAMARDLMPVAGRDWRVGAVVKEATVLSTIRASLTTSAVVAASVITLFVLLGLALARTLAGPLLAIARETRRIERLELEERRFRASRFEEIAEIQEAYAHLKVGLRAFEKYVPGKLVRTLLAERVDPEPGGQEQEVTLFFSDIRGFTSFAQKMPTQELADVLGVYFETMVSEISQSGGTVDKFVGDGVMAFWNAPRSVPDHPLQAVRTAIRLRDAVAAMERADQLFTRMGIHTGDAMVGNFGAPSRFSYTALGDAVNLASRLEGINKQYGTQIMISGATEARLDDSIVRRRLDRVAVVGRTEGIDVYEVLGFEGEVDESTLIRARRYEVALVEYFEGRFSHARSLFEELEDDDESARVMAHRSRRYMDAPPDESWDGVFSLLEK